MQRGHNTSKGRSRGICSRIVTFVAELLMGRHAEQPSREIPATTIAGATDNRAREADQKNGGNVPVQKYGPVKVRVSSGRKQGQDDEKLKKKLLNIDDEKIRRFIEETKKSFDK